MFISTLQYGVMGHFPVFWTNSELIPLQIEYTQVVLFRHLDMFHIFLTAAINDLLEGNIAHVGLNWLLALSIHHFCFRKIQERGKKIISQSWEDCTNWSRYCIWASLETWLDIRMWVARSVRVKSCIHISFKCFWWSVYWNRFRCLIKYPLGYYMVSIHISEPTSPKLLLIIFYLHRVKLAGFSLNLKPPFTRE